MTSSSPYAPDWYRRPLSQTICLGLVFFCVFAAYTTIQFYAASTYGQVLAANSVSAVYLAFMIICLGAPAIVNKLGSRRTMFVGILGYASFVLLSLIYFWTGVEWLVVLGGAILGCGSALLWTAQGRLVLQYAAVAERCNQAHAVQRGTIMGVFWALYQCSSLFGGAISFVYYSHRPDTDTKLYIVFLIFILLGAAATNLLLPPSMLKNHTPKEEKRRTEQEGDDFPTFYAVEETELIAKHCDEVENDEVEDFGVPSTDPYSDDPSSEDWVEEMVNTLRLFVSQPMLHLSVLFFYIGFKQPYQQATFGNRFFSRRTIGVELIIFNLMGIFASIFFGRALDTGKIPDAHEQTSSRGHNHRRGAAIKCLVIFVIVNSCGNLLSFLQEFQSFDHVWALDISDPRSILPSLAFACWGFADSQIQVYSLWLLGSVFSSPNDHSRAVGFLNCAQSLGYTMGFFIIPTSRLSAILQLVLTSCIFVIGTALSLLELPK
jgi:MFS family permease